MPAGKDQSLIIFDLIFLEFFLIYNQLLPANMWFNFLVHFRCECNGNRKSATQCLALCWKNMCNWYPNRKFTFYRYCAWLSCEVLKDNVIKSLECTLYIELLKYTKCNNFHYLTSIRTFRTHDCKLRRDYFFRNENVGSYLIHILKKPSPAYIIL